MIYHFYNFHIISQSTFKPVPDLLTTFPQKQAMCAHTNVDDMNDP